MTSTNNGWSITQAESDRVSEIHAELRTNAETTVQLPRAMARYFDSQDDILRVYSDTHRGVHDFYAGQDTDWSRALDMAVKNKGPLERFQTMVTIAESIANAYLTDDAEAENWRAQCAQYADALNGLRGDSQFDAIALSLAGELKDNILKMIALHPEAIASDPAIVQALANGLDENGGQTTVSRGEHEALYWALAHYIAYKRGELPSLELDLSEEDIPYYFGVMASSCLEITAEEAAYAAETQDEAVAGMGHSGVGAAPEDPAAKKAALKAKIKRYTSKAIYLMLAAAGTVAVLTLGKILLRVAAGLVAISAVIGLVFGPGKLIAVARKVKNGVIYTVRFSADGVRRLRAFAQPRVVALKQKIRDIWNAVKAVAIHLYERAKAAYDSVSDKVTGKAADFVEDVRGIYEEQSRTRENTITV